MSAEEDVPWQNTITDTHGRVFPVQAVLATGIAKFGDQGFAMKALGPEKLPGRYDEITHRTSVIVFRRAKKTG